MGSASRRVRAQPRGLGRLHVVRKTFSLVLGSAGISGDRESDALELFLAQPIDRAELLVGRFSGSRP